MRNPSTVLALALVACMALPAYAQQRIGKATSVKPQAQGSVAGELAPDSDIHANETVNTSTGGQANLQFLDNTMLSVGPMSTVRLDKFVYDPNKASGAVVINVTRGAYRFVTGVQDSRNYVIKTPYATLGVRGTVLGNVWLASNLDACERAQWLIDAPQLTEPLNNGKITAPGPKYTGLPCNNSRLGGLQARLVNIGHSRDGQ